MNEHQAHLLNLLNSNNKVLAMLAPSFPIDFPHPQIVPMLKKLGFEKVTELTFGARMTNFWYREYIEKHPDQKVFIASPCPTVFNIVKKYYPTLTQYLIPYSSPMLSMAKICRKKFSDYKIVFISPCQAKRVFEAPLHKDFIDLVITFKELAEILEQKGVKKEDFDGYDDYDFDAFITERTKIYPISGGLAKTSHVKNFFKPEEICIVDGAENNKKVLDDLKNGISQYRFIDILNCPGGCVGGPDIKNRDLPEEERDRIITQYRDKSIKDFEDGTEGRKEYAMDIDFEIDI